MHTQAKKAKSALLFVDGVYLSAIKECLWTSDKTCRVQVFPSAGSTNCRPNVSWARRPKSQQACAQKAPPLCFPPSRWWAAYLPSAYSGLPLAPLQRVSVCPGVVGSPASPLLVESSIRILRVLSLHLSLNDGIIPACRALILIASTYM